MTSPPHNQLISKQKKEIINTHSTNLTNEQRRIIKPFIVIISLSIVLGIQINTNKGITMEWTAISTDSESIYKLNPKTWAWTKDERWEKRRYVYPSISPSGKYLAFKKFVNKGFYIIDEKGKDVVDYQANNNEYLSFISWNPDERSLAILGTDYESEAKQTSNIYLYTIHINKLELIYLNANNIDYPTPPFWNKSGTKLFFINEKKYVVEFDMITNNAKEITNANGVHWLSDNELVVRKEKNRYYHYNMITKEENYLFKLGFWEYPPIFISPDQKYYLCWDTKPRRITLYTEWFTVVRQFPSGKKIKVISNYGANWFSWQ